MNMRGTKQTESTTENTMLHCIYLTERCERSQQQL